MNKKEIKIQQLVHQSNYLKYEISTENNLFIGGCAIILSIWIGFAVASFETVVKIIFGIIVIVSIVLLGKYIEGKNKENKDKIKKISQEIHELYEELLK